MKIIIKFNLKLLEVKLSKKLKSFLKFKKLKIF